MLRGQEDKVFCIKNTTRNEPIFAQPGEMKGGDFFAKTQRANGVKRSEDLGDLAGITCHIAGLDLYKFVKRNYELLLLQPTIDC